MKRINKRIMLLGTLSTALVTTVSIVLASCGTTKKNDKDKGFNTQPFINNANMNFAQANANLGTVDMVKKILTSGEGIDNIASKMGDELFYSWFKNNSISSIKSYYNDQVKEAKKTLSDKRKTFKNVDAFQVNILDPVGVTEEAYIQSNILENLKTKFLDYVFSKDYLAIVDSNGKVDQINNNSPFVKGLINDPKNVNATMSGQRNNFKFIGNSDSNAADIDYAYADFVGFVFDKWAEENVPILTPSVLFKNDANPKDSLLFNQDYFGSALTADASYKFQFFKPINQDFENPNASTIYATFLKNKDNFIQMNLKGAIDIPDTFTQDSSTRLTSLLATSFNTYVAPYAASSMYKFGSLGINTFNDAMVPTNAAFNASIMGNFIVKNNIDPAKGEFKLPYIQQGENPFGGEYANMTGIKDVVNISNSPWIITRNEFGVHVIGIDRYKAIEEASKTKTNVKETQTAILNELKNTILWRAAQDKAYSAGNKIDLQKKLKDYATSNLSSLLVEYAITSTKTGRDNLFTGPWMPTSFKLMDLLPNEDRELAQKANEVKQYNKLFSSKEAAKNKIYNLQEQYVGIRDSSKWRDLGIAGVLPFTRNTQTGDFDVFNKLFNVMFATKDSAISSLNDNSILTNYETVKTEYLTTLDKFMTKVKPAGQSFFSKYPKSGVSQTVITDIPFVNKILINAKSSQVINDVFYDSKYKSYLGSIWNFDGYKFNGTNDTIPAKPSVTSTTTNFTELNQWILSNLQKSFQSEYVMLNFTSNLSNSLYYYGNWDSLTTLQARAVALDKESINKNRLNKANQDNLLKWEENHSLNAFIKTIAWLLTWDNELQTFTFNNLKRILSDSISVSKIGYVGWTNSSNIYASSLDPQRKYGVVGATTDMDIQQQMQSDTKFYQYPYFLTKLNPYSYIGAPNTTDATNVSKTYFGNNDTYYSNADISATIKSATGFLGFQSLNSTILPNTLPSDLYSGKLLSQNISNPDKNFKGALYNYNKENNLTKARQELVSFINNNSSTYELSNLASKLIDIGFNFNEAQIKDLESVKIGVDYDGMPLTLIQRKQKLVAIANDTTAIPNVAFDQIKGEYLWNNKENFGTKSTTIFTDESKKGLQTQYIISQFNDADIEQLVFYNSTKKSFLNPNKLLGLTDDAFFKAIIKLARNGEVQNRSNNAWTEYFNRTKYEFYDRSLAKLFGEAIVANWKDFS